MTLTIYLVRHGETDWNLEGRLQGWTDIPLNARGRQQAQQLAFLLKDIPFDGIYASDLKRCRETAEIIAGNNPVCFLAELRERSMGSFEGLIVRNDPASYAEFRQRFFDGSDVLENGESFSQHMERIRNTLTMIREKHRTGNILIVGHGGTNSLILLALECISKEQLIETVQQNGEIYVIEVCAEPDRVTWRKWRGQQ